MQLKYNLTKIWLQANNHACEVIIKKERIAIQVRFVGKFKIFLLHSKPDDYIVMYFQMFLYDPLIHSLLYSVKLDAFI